MKETEQILIEIEKEHITTILKKNFFEEKMNKFFDIHEGFEFVGSVIKLNKDNSIKLDFKTASRQLGYQLLLIFELSNEEEFSHKLQTDFQKILENNVDKIVIWSNKSLPPETLQSLKTLNINIISFKVEEIAGVELITNFFPISSKNYVYTVILNKLCNLLVKRLKKLFHIVLSEIAAPTYDTEYGTEANIGTRSIMTFEEKVLNDEIRKYFNENKLQRGHIAIDVGCGTGRHSFKICALFDKVYGFDFSPKMISQANENKKDKKINNVIFSVADLEYEDVHYENEFMGKVDFIVASFGMGSFIEDTAKIVRRYNQWLKPGGRILISFYNESSIILKITPNWRDTSLAAHIDTENNTLQVKLSEDIIFQIYCKPFNVNVKSMTEAVFKIERIFTYPTTIALLPNSLLRNKSAFDIFSRIDEQIAGDETYGSGHYVLLIGTKAENNGGLEEHLRVNKMLVAGGYSFKKISHDFVLSIKDAKKQLGVSDASRMIKTVVLNDKQNKRYVAIVLPSNKRVHTEQILHIINKEFLPKSGKEVNKNHLKLATETEILKLGFPIGGIAPFGFDPTYTVIPMIDQEIFERKKGTIFTGAGNNISTLEIDIKSFKQLTKTYKKIEIKT